MHGGTAQGIGTALYEEIPYDEMGQPLATSFGDYMVPCAPEIPTVRVAHMVHPALATVTDHDEDTKRGPREGWAALVLGHCDRRRASRSSDRAGVAA